MKQSISNAVVGCVMVSLSLFIYNVYELRHFGENSILDKIMGILPFISIAGYIVWAIFFHNIANGQRMFTSSGIATVAMFLILISNLINFLYFLKLTGSYFLQFESFYGGEFGIFFRYLIAITSINMLLRFFSSIRNGNINIIILKFGKIGILLLVIIRIVSLLRDSRDLQIKDTAIIIILLTSVSLLVITILMIGFFFNIEAEKSNSTNEKLNQAGDGLKIMFWSMIFAGIFAIINYLGLKSNWENKINFSKEIINLRDAFLLAFLIGVYIAGKRLQSIH